MLLRASGEMGGEELDLRAVTEGENAESGLPGGEALTALAEAAVHGSEDATRVARERVRRELGDAALVDAAAVIGNFERMVRIADGTGIPLDAPVAMATADLRDELGLGAFGGAESTGEIRGVKRLAGRLLARSMPMLVRLMRMR
jgi:hypothetical protein